ncbi:2-amino-4-hydroxy-6-hydroxymethyldihydropteridine diphosphokinase [Sulfurimonas sp.]|uniref:2-amino-4-hydroxy-6- hydroxymethyldihydropteridine diphosphokinase n=1 Tax=Sulfurimonas sp. TaxID=2022749 RepID=UPI003565B196
MYLKRKLNDELSIYKGLRYGYKTSQKSTYRHQVIVGIGGNTGDVKRRFEHLFCFFKKSNMVEVLQTSSILKNPPFGFLEQDDFFNALIVLKTNMLPMQILNYLQKVEKKFRRVRTFANAPRSLDLDIIFYDNICMNKEKLTLPHPGWNKRDSVLIPLMDLYR